MKKKNKKRNKRPKKEDEFDVQEQDEHFYFIAGSTPGGAPYGITWEEAKKEGLINENGGDIEIDIDDEELPF